jgi:hypothetical protein
MCDKGMMGLRGGKRRRLKKITRGGTSWFFVPRVILFRWSKDGRGLWRVWERRNSSCRLVPYKMGHEATRYGLDGPRIESRRRPDSPHPPDLPWGPPNLLYNGYRMSFSGVKQTGRGSDHPPTSSAEVNEIVELHLSFPSVSSWHFVGGTSRFYIYRVKHINTLCRQKV